MPAKKPKLTALERDIRKDKKILLSSQGRTGHRISGSGVAMLNRSRRFPERFTYTSAREYAIAKGVQVQHETVR